MIRTITWALLVGCCCGSAAQAQETSPIPGSKLHKEDRLESVLQHVNPALEGWDTEVLSSKVQDQLKALIKSAFEKQALPDFVADEIQSSALIPAALEALREGTNLRVSRGTIAPEVKPGKAHLLEALSALRQSQGAEGHPHVKVKVVRIDAGQASQIVTQSLVRVWNEDSPSGRHQCDAIWTTRWLVQGEEIALASVQAMAYTESHAAAPLFADCSEAVLGANASWSEQLLRGTDDWCGQIERGASMDQYAHNGLVIGDFDGDGLEDLYLCQAGGLPNRLFIQNADGSATDRSAEFGVDWLDDSKGALFSDFDGDGTAELVVSTIVGILVAKRSEDGTYEIKKVLKHPGAYSLSAADADGDGRVDIYSCSYSTSEKKSGLPAPYHDANNGPPNHFFRNLGDLEFEDVTDEVGFDHNNSRFSFAASWADFDRDGDPDLYVANDFGRNNLYRNDGGRFTDVAGSAGVEDISAGMGVSWGDFDGDGWQDIYVSNMFSSAGQRIAYQRRFLSQADNETREGFQRHARGNSLFRNNGDGTFSDVTVAANAWMGRWSWGAAFTDFDNDGHEDLFVPNGFITNELTKDL